MGEFVGFVESLWRVVDRPEAENLLIDFSTFVDLGRSILHSIVFIVRDFSIRMYFPRNSGLLGDLLSVVCPRGFEW